MFALQVLGKIHFGAPLADPLVTWSCVHPWSSQDDRVVYGLYVGLFLGQI